MCNKRPCPYIIMFVAYWLVNYTRPKVSEIVLVEYQQCLESGLNPPPKMFQSVYTQVLSIQSATGAGIDDLGGIS